MRKNVIITGCNRGIGKSMLLLFAEKNYDIWACARKYTEGFGSYVRELSERTGALITPVYFDLLDRDEVKRGMNQIVQEKKSIDVLINNAGVPYGASFMMTSASKLREIYEINVFAQVQIMQIAARKMMKQREGCIINMCSVGGIEASSGYLAYGSSKAALIWITKAVSKELGRYNVRVNGIAPGLVDTDMGYYKSESELEKVLNRTSIKRMGHPDEIARAALYMASDDAAYMTGHIMVLDGGRLC